MYAFVLPKTKDERTVRFVARVAAGRRRRGARGMRPEPCSATAADTLHYTNVIIMNVRHDNRGNHQNKSRLFTDWNMEGFCTIFSRFK